MFFPSELVDLEISLFGAIVIKCSPLVYFSLLYSCLVYFFSNILTRKFKECEYIREGMSQAE